MQVDLPRFGALESERARNKNTVLANNFFLRNLLLMHKSRPLVFSEKLQRQIVFSGTLARHHAG